MPIRDSAPTGAPVWIDLSTSDPQRSKDFYSELFGWTYEDTGPEYGNYVNFSKNGSLVAGLMQNQQPGSPDGWTTYLASENAEMTAEAVLSAGGRILMKPMSVQALGTMAIVADPSGGVVGVWQPGEHKGYGVIGEHGAPAWLELHTHDYGPAVRFYQQAFGWTTTVIGASDDFRYTVYEKDGTQYAGIMDASSFLPSEVPSNWQIYFQVADIDAALAQVEKLGGAILQPAEDSPYGRLGQVADSTGATLKLMTPPAG